MGWELRGGLNSMPSLPSPQTMAQFRPQSHRLFMSIRSLWPNRQVEKLRQTHGQRTLFWVVDFLYINKENQNTSKDDFPCLLLPSVSP